MEKSTIKTKLISLNWGKSTDGTTILCAITKEGNLHTKSTVRSYLTALNGASMAVSLVKDRLESGDVAILSGASISWERTTYAPNEEHERNGDVVILDKEDIVDHILEVDLNPVSEVLLLKYLEEHKDLSPLQERILLKGFGLE